MNDLAITIDLGASNLRAALISKDGKILKKISLKTPGGKNAKNDISGIIIKLIENILKQADQSKISGIGISVGSPINQEKGEIVNPPNMNFKNLPIVSILKKHFKIPIILLNDCNAAVLGEKFFGGAKNYKNIVYITISSGIGGGALIDDRLINGKNGSAAEIGHFIIDTKYNFLCSCKKGFGHWEGYCSGNNLPRFFNQWIKLNKIDYKNPVSNSEDIFGRARNSDKVILKFLKEIGKINGRGISNVIAAYNPEIIILGGAVILKNRNFIIPYFKKNIDRFLSVPKISTTRLGDNVSLCGSAAMVFNMPRN